MHLSEKSRTTMFTTFTELMGEEVAEEMMAQYPASDGDEVVTRSFLRAELGELRSELRTEMADLRTELHTELRSQTKWMTGMVITTLFGGLAASAAIAQAFG